MHELLKRLPIRFPLRGHVAHPGRAVSSTTRGMIHLIQPDDRQSGMRSQALINIDRMKKDYQYISCRFYQEAGVVGRDGKLHA